MNRPLQRVDFQRSSIRWVTRSEKSMGAFQLEALVRLWGDAGAPPKLFALGTAVMAGNMYVEGGLCKNPPYMFQAAGGEGEHAIFRTDLSPCRNNVVKKLWERNKIQDSIGPNSQTFDAFDIHLEMDAAKSVQDYEEIAEHFSRQDFFTCRVTIDSAIAEKMELEFPVKHLNLLPSCQMWQLETGPILFPLRGDSVNTVAGFLPYFVHANRFDCADFSPDFPFPQEVSLRALSGRMGKISCQLQLLVKNE